MITRWPPLHYAGMRGCPFHGLVPMREKHTGVQKDILTRSPCVSVWACMFLCGLLHTGVRPSVVRCTQPVELLTRYTAPASANALEGRLAAASPAVCSQPGAGLVLPVCVQASNSLLTQTCGMPTKGRSSMKEARSGQVESTSKVKPGLAMKRCHWTQASVPISKQAQSILEHMKAERASSK